MDAIFEDLERELKTLERGAPPENAKLAGYGALLAAFDLAAPPPQTVYASLPVHRKGDAPGWALVSVQQAPAPTFESHLTFALRYEGVDLAILKKLFEATGPEPVAAMVRNAPTGQYARRAWFLYEWLTGDVLDLPDAGAVPYALAINPDQQLARDNTVNSSRHKVRDNLPGSRQFCPLVRRTDKITAMLARNLSEEARQVVARIPTDVVARASAFLLLKDSRSSFAIEGETPPQDRIQRWGRAIGEAGRNPLSHDELLRLQRIVIGDQRFVHMGYRTEGGFVGEHDRRTQAPLPDHISARHQDLQDLMEGLIAFVHDFTVDLDAVVAASIAAFGFVYIHPFEDGNGRIHRYLIHHLLAKAGFNPPGVVFPISSAIEGRIDEYRRVLETHSSAILPLIEWRATETNNVEVLNETADYYRYFDATPHVEFLYDCIAQTIEVDLPQEADFLRRYDQFRRAITGLVDMPDRTIDLLFRFLQQNDGRLSKRARAGEFQAFTEKEVADVEAIYVEAFGKL